MRPHAARGAALIAVLWLLVLLSTVAGSYAYAVRTEYNLARNNLQSSKARLLVEAGLNRAIAELLLPSGLDRWSVDGSPSQFAFAGGTVTVRIQAATGLVDINEARPLLLANLLAVVAVPPGQRDRLVDAILDWRDADDLRHLNGAEARDYRLEGVGYTPANRPFDYLGQVDLVFGMKPDIYRRLRPFLTVYSGRAQVDRNLAPRTVLLAVLDGDDRAVDAALAARAESVPSAGGNYHLSVAARLPDGTTAALEAAVAINPEDGVPYVLLERQEGESVRRDDA